jgi:ribosome-associated heat shock protein Hsp15
MGRSGAEKPLSAVAGETISRQRLDLWIWHARFLRSRKDCVSLVLAGFVRVNGMRAVQAGYAVKPGDVLTLALPGRTVVVVVVTFSHRRGNAEAAHLLYRFADAGIGSC